jgi:hypothetical protein
MANDMNSAMNALRGILGDNADEKIRAVMGSLAQSNGASSPQETAIQPTAAEEIPVEDVIQESTPSVNTQGMPDIGDSMQSLMNIKNVVDEMGHGANDPRSNLLLSLRPYMREGRQRSIDTAIRMLNITKLSGLFK